MARRGTGDMDGCGSGRMAICGDGFIPQKEKIRFEKVTI